MHLKCNHILQQRKIDLFLHHIYSFKMMFHIFKICYTVVIDIDENRKVQVQNEMNVACENPIMWHYEYSMKN